MDRSKRVDDLKRNKNVEGSKCHNETNCVLRMFSIVSKDATLQKHFTAVASGLKLIFLTNPLAFKPDLVVGLCKFELFIRAHILRL